MFGRMQKQSKPRNRYWRRCQFLIVLSATLVAGQSHGQMGGMGGSGFGSSGLGRGLPSGPKDTRPAYQPPVIHRSEKGTPIVAVKIIGNDLIPDSRIRPSLQTRPGRDFDPEIVQADVRKLSSTGMFRNVRTYRKQLADGGVEVTFEVFELPIIQYIRFEGNDGKSNRSLRKEVGLTVGESLNRYRVEEAKRKLEEFYVESGYGDAKIEIVEGIEAGDEGIVFQIYEGSEQRIFRTRFEGNTIASDARLKTQIQSKPGYAWFLKGQVNRDKIEQDRERLVEYYRGLGYFKARVSRYLKYSDSGKWLTLTFVIDEGPRYKIRNVSVVGNTKFTQESLAQRLEVKEDDYFDARAMNRDLNALRDTYGSQGYIHADINADPRFLEEPGVIDLVYDVDEGEQYRVGRVIVNIEGENPRTRRNVVINRLSLSPNDILDIREIRASERRLRSSQLFLNDPIQGAAPTIVVRPPELNNGEQLARQPDPSQGSPY